MYSETTAVRAPAGVVDHDALTWVTICHDTMTILRAWVVLAYFRREIALRNRPQEACSPVVGSTTGDPRKLRLIATMTPAATRITTPRTTVAFRRTMLHSMQVNPNPGAYPSVHTAQTCTNAARNVTSGAEEKRGYCVISRLVAVASTDQSKGFQEPSVTRNQGFPHFGSLVSHSISQPVRQSVECEWHLQLRVGYLAE